MRRISFRALKLTTTTCAAFLSVGVAACEEPLPPFETIKASVEAYANCIDQAVARLAKGSGSSPDVALQAVADCRDYRDAALRLKAVPVFAPTVEEFDDIHNGLARNLTADARGEPREAGKEG